MNSTVKWWQLIMGLLGLLLWYTTFQLGYATGYKEGIEDVTCVPITFYEEESI